MRKLSKHGKCKLNNRGMSLVEVLVAMIILSVVSLTFLRSFAYSAQLNQRARVKQHTLTLAQSVMESFKAYDITTLDTQFGSGTAVSEFKIYPLGSGTKEGNFASGYWMRNIELDGSKYDVKISITDSTSAETTVVTAADIVTGEDVNKYDDAFFVQDMYEQNLIYEQIIAALDTNGIAPASKPTVETIDKSKIKINSRKLKVNITTNTVQVVSTYSYNVTDYEFEKADGTMGMYSVSNATVSTPSCEVYNNSSGSNNTHAYGAKLRNIYLYYYPAYRHTVGQFTECAGDEIEIDNSGGSELPAGTYINVYLVKQKNPALGYGDAWLITCEGDYSVSVSGAHNNVNLYHNLGERLIGAGAGNYSTTGSIVDKAALLDVNTGKRLLYDVKIEVYEAGEPTVLYTLNGTTNAR